MTTDPRQTHETDQAIAVFGTLGTAFAVFMREAMASGAKRGEAERAATAAVRTWITEAMPQRRPA